MATINKTIGSTYELIVNSTDNFLFSFEKKLSPFFEFVLMDSETLPSESLNGHKLESLSKEYLNRDIIGAQFLYARSSSNAPLNFILSTWTA
jgi:hypothetical protein